MSLHPFPWNRRSQTPNLSNHENYIHLQFRHFQYSECPIIYSFYCIRNNYRSDTVFIMKSLIDDVSNSIGLFIFCNCRRYYNFTVGIIATAAHSCFKAYLAKTKRQKLGISKRMGYARQKQAYNTRNVFLDNNFISISLMFSVN